MITPEGGYVIAQPDSYVPCTVPPRSAADMYMNRMSWQKQTTRSRALTEADIRAEPPADSSLACLFCSWLFREPVQTPCCGAVYCEECVQTHLLEHDFDCPACLSKITSLDKLVSEKGVRARVQAQIDKAIAESNADAESDDSSTTSKAPQVRSWHSGIQFSSLNRDFH